MANAQVEIIEENVETFVESATSSARKVVHTGLGAVATVRENAEKLYADTNSYTNELAEKGFGISEERRQAFNEFVEPYQERVRVIGDDVEARFNKATESFLARLNIPTADSIEDLNKKIAALGRKVDKLAKEIK
ncbi:MAG: phasin family protein [Chloroflexota bacterium]